MEVATVASGFALHRPMLASKTSCQAVKHSRSLNGCCTSLSTSLVSPLSCSSVCREFSGLTLRTSSLNPANSSGSKGNRDFVTMVSPYYFENSDEEQPPPDLASYLFANRIIYLGTTIVTEVYELLVAEFIYLNYTSRKKPIYFYINSTGSYKGDEKFGNEVEAISLHDIMRLVRAPVYTLCVGTAWGEAALLLAAGAKGHRFSLPSASIMIRQPISRFEGQASAIDRGRQAITDLKNDLVKLLSRHIGKSRDQIEADIVRPKYFNPSEAVEYGIIDKVLLKERGTGEPAVIADMMND